MEIIFFTSPLNASPYCWLIGIGSSKLGVHKNNGWCMQLDERTIFFDSEDKCMPLVPILEVAPEKFVNFLKKINASVPDYAKVIHRFPKELLLKHVFHTSFSGYWPEKALAWLADDSNLQVSFEDELMKFIDNKAMPQKARQQAQKIMNLLKNNNP